MNRNPLTNTPMCSSKSAGAHHKNASATRARPGEDMEQPRSISSTFQLRLRRHAENRLSLCLFVKAHVGACAFFITAESRRGSRQSDLL
jgi:hypothetical protein